MEIRTVAQEFFLTPSLRDHLESRLRSAFSSLRDRIASICVVLRELNQDGGRRNMVCEVNVDIPGQPHVVIRDAQEDIYYAIDNAIKRAAYRAVRIMACGKAVVGLEMPRLR